MHGTLPAWAHDTHGSSPISGWAEDVQYSVFGLLRCGFSGPTTLLGPAIDGRKLVSAACNDQSSIRTPKTTAISIYMVVPCPLPRTISIYMVAPSPGPEPYQSIWWCLAPGPEPYQSIWWALPLGPECMASAASALFLGCMAFCFFTYITQFGFVVPGSWAQQGNVLA